MTPTLAAIIYTILNLIVIIFQGLLAAGVPWGAASMGGKFPGKYPPKMRVVATTNILLLIFLNLIVLTRAGIVFPDLLSISRAGIWFVVSFCTIGTIVNLITPSKIERIWLPVVSIELIMSIVVAIG